MSSHEGIRRGIESDADERFRSLQLELFRGSVLKQAKWQALARAIGPNAPNNALDLGSDNGVISLMLRRAGGRWTSADLTPETVSAIRRMVGERVHLLTGSTLPFPDADFDLIVVVDLLEHVADDRALLAEMDRCLAPGGRVILSLPRLNPRTVLHRLRHAMGLTDEWHGHQHPGYDRQVLGGILPSGMHLVSTRTYTRFFSHLLDTALNWRYQRVHKDTAKPNAKGMVVTGDRINLASVRNLQRLYPVMRAFAALDALLPWTSGYMMVAELVKEPGSTVR